MADPDEQVRTPDLRGGGWVRPLVLLLVAASALTACAGEPGPRAETAPAAGLEVRSLDPPSAPGSLGPNLTLAGGRPLLSWLERSEGDQGPRHRLVVSRLAVDGWSEPVVVAEGDDFFANWADFPAVVEAGDGALLAHWLAKTGDETYAYSIFLARSEDGGLTWRRLGTLNDDATPTEHGFVSYVAEADGARAFWLDGREMVDGGAMALRTARIDASVGSSEVLDERVCECCSTSAAVTTGGPVIVYRDRSEQEIRDISIVRRAAEGWTASGRVAADDWRIPGCPVNGPEIAAAGDRAAVAWFTAAGEEPKVKLAFSDDGGASWGEPRMLDAEAPFGRVDLELDDRGATWVVWLAKRGERAEVRLQHIARDGSPGPAHAVAETAGSRSSGFPRLLRLGERLYLAWVEIGPDAAGEAQRLRVAEIAI